MAGRYVNNQPPQERERERGGVRLKRVKHGLWDKD